MRILLVGMPFAAVHRPALGISLLQAVAREGGLDCDVAYLNLVVADELGRDVYERLAGDLPYPALVGEWVFSEALYGRDRDPGKGYLEDVLSPHWGLAREDLELAREVRALAPGLIELSLRRLAWGDYDIVGFSAFCAQNLASLALAKRVKELHPRVRIVFGGGDWHGCMGVELHRRFPFVDFACTGEGDDLLPALAAALSSGEDAALTAVPGLVVRRGRQSLQALPPAPVRDLDALPVPDYSDYFTALSGCGFAQRLRPSALAETSRGCLWGERHPCRFCGLSGSTREYRSKSRDRIESELRGLAKDSRVSVLELVDNMVPEVFLSEVLPGLAEDPLPVPVFFETRAVAGHETMQAMAAARASVQPGIESLSDHVLRLMRKGTRALENVRFLRLCRTYGVRPYWNILHGFPGETDADYRRVLDMLPALHFLEAPMSCARFSLDRFSPYFEAPSRNGLPGARPLAAYRYLYPFPESAVRRIAHAFTFDDTSEVPESTLSALKEEVRAWKEVLEPGELEYEPSAQGAVVTDTRPEAKGYEWRLDSLEDILYTACEQVRTRDFLEGLASRSGFGDGDVSGEVGSRLSSFVDRRLMVSVDDSFLSLALFREDA